VQPFNGEILVDDLQVGRKSLCVIGWETEMGDIVMELHNAVPPNGHVTRIGNFGSAWTLKKVKRAFLVTGFELTLLNEEPPVKLSCFTRHKLGDMLEKAIESWKP
jgi:hypothetical protein